MAWEKFKRILGLRVTPTSAVDASIQQLVNQSFLNRRKNFRIMYPHLGASGPFPQVHFAQTEMLIGNISVGGLHIIDDTERLGNEVGEIINLDISWPDFTTRMRARIVSASLENRHLQFVDFNAQFFLRINQIIPAAVSGSRFHKVHNDSGRLAAAEMWTSQTNDTLVFPHPGENGDKIELFWNGEKYIFESKKSIYMLRTQEVTSAATSQAIYVLLANIPKPSSRIKVLIEDLVLRLDIAGLRKANSDKTGSD